MSEGAAGENQVSEGKTIIQVVEEVLRELEKEVKQIEESELSRFSKKFGVAPQEITKQFYRNMPFAIFNFTKDVYIEDYKIQIVFTNDRLTGIWELSNDTEEKFNQNFSDLKCRFAKKLAERLGAKISFDYSKIYLLLPDNDTIIID